MNMALMVSEQDSVREGEIITNLKADGVAGFVIMPTEDPADRPEIRALRAEQFPFVLIDRQLPGRRVLTDLVMSDHRGAAKLGTEYLLQLGHRNIAFVKHSEDQTASVSDRIFGYRDALAEYGVVGDTVCAFASTDARAEPVEKLLDRNNVTAIMTANSYVAIDVIKLCRRKGIQLPHDLSLITFDDLSMIKHLEVPLTTLSQESEAIGRRSVELLVKLIHNEQSGLPYQPRGFTQVTYPMRLIQRASCAPPAARGTRISLEGRYDMGDTYEPPGTPAVSTEQSLDRPS